ncbi:uncharacterized protein LOC18024041 isoform X1 [Eutrema salsugineum]|uniref:uncharacterized protein LOC18024041 isoform X1 n=1 Tax=Eutrema salsugineum TaxID=72664 RepID=UPI000CED513D|nr:uncharacterized protein LOC18024041 isoform X1 [Eutrema salsugineum]
MELDYVATDMGSDGDDNENGDGGGDRVPNSEESNELGPGKLIGSKDDWDSETKPRYSKMKRENSSQVKDEDLGDQFYEVYNKADEKNMGMASKELHRVSSYKSFLSEFDGYVTSEKLGSGVSRALSYGFEMGDMVWGKVKSHPWWPGHIYNEAFVSPSVRRMKKMGYVLVAFYGDSSYGWFDPAQLIPFEPHFAEKSEQTNSSNFAKAVEEAIVEAGKRSALGLVCKCRNPFNFRRSNVQGYFVVDVPDYELQAVYSSKQIKKARDSFSSAQTLSFVKRCALAPQECGSDSLKFYQRKAAVYAFRRVVFEEFDETYEQAFGARSEYTSVKSQDPLNRASPRVPLRGSLVIAETLGDPKTSKNAMNVQASSQLQGINGSSAGNHVVQRKTPPMKHERTGLLSMDLSTLSGDSPGKESSVSKLSRDADKGSGQESKVIMRDKAALFPDHEKFEAMTSLKQDKTSATHSRSNNFMKGKVSARGAIKIVNALKRSSGEMDSEHTPSGLKKKKKESGSELNRDNPDKREALSSGETWAKKSSELGSAERHSNMLTVRDSKLDALQLLSNLQALSLDPFFVSSDRSSIRAVRQFFLCFRSLVYQKSLAKSPQSTKPSKFPKTLTRTHEPSKAEIKRQSSGNHQEILSTKKLKKSSQSKTMPCDKKTNQEEEKRPNLAPINPVNGPVPINAKAQAGKKMVPSAKKIEPTMLVIKFPRGTSLPSTAQLKARFGRFGQLDQSAIRVLWKSSICRVVFLYKLDAQTALRYASGSHSLFGNVNVTYFLRDVEAPYASEGHEPKKAKTGEPILEPLSQWIDRAQPPVHQSFNIQPKSCLKKPGNNGNGNRGKARVRFMLGGKETGTPFLDSSKNNGNHSSSSSSVAIEFVTNNTQNMVPPNLHPIPWKNSKRKPVNNKVDHLEPPLKPSECRVDISEQIMELLLWCNDVVSNVTGFLGYVPYHPL